MVKQRSDKCKSSGKEREDRVVLSETTFDPLSIEIKYPGTAVLLLKSQEHTALVTAAAALSKFGSKSRENLGILFDLNVINLILPLLTHEEIFIRRFATKLLAEMSALSNVRNFLLNSECYISYFTSVLMNDTDVFIHEYVTLILAELSKDMFGVAQLLEQCNNFDFLFERVTSPDPDVKKNSIEIICNLLRDPIAAQKLVDAKGFSFTSMYEVLKQPYPVMQLLGLDAINFLVARTKDENVQELFRVSRGPHALLDILDNDEFYDLHKKVLEILSIACDNQKTAQLLCTSGGIQKLFKFLENYDKKLTPDVLNVIVRLANSADGRKELYKREMVPFLLNLLHDQSNPDVAGISCYGIAKMTQYGPAADTIASSHAIQDIVGFIKNATIKQSLRHAATYCLAELLASDARNCAELLDIKGQSYLIWMLKQPSDKVLLETQITALQCLTAIGGYPEFREQIIDVDLIDALCTPFELTNDATFAESKVAHCHALSIFCIEQTARDLFVRLEGPRRLYYLLLDSESVPVRDAAARLISQLCIDEVVAPLLILAGCLECMIRNRSTSRIVPSWETGIKTLLNAYLPAKFALTGRLSLHDITKDGFYVMRRNTHPFPILDQLFTLDVSPTQTIYTLNLAEPYSKVEQYSNESVSGKISPSQAAEKNRFSMYSADVTRAIMAEQHKKLDTDPYLYDLVKLFKCKLNAAEPEAAYEQERPGLVNISYIKSRAKMLGEFVACQMSGPDPTTKCLDHQLELHLSEIKYDIGTNIIPLGQLRVGSYLERALLFKVIADRICLPAALVRGDYGKAWIEIAVPEIGTHNEAESHPDFDTHKVQTRQQSTISARSSAGRSLSAVHQSFECPTKERVSIDGHTSSILPTMLLRSNYLVDLMETPGELIRLGTKRAGEYCSFRQSF